MTKHTVESLMGLAHSYAMHFTTLSEHKHHAALHTALSEVLAERDEAYSEIERLANHFKAVQAERDQLRAERDALRLEAVNASDRAAQYRRELQNLRDHIQGDCV